MPEEKVADNNKERAELVALKQRERSDRLSIQSLQEILRDRQQECANFRNQCELIERSVSDLKD